MGCRALDDQLRAELGNYNRFTLAPHVLCWNGQLWSDWTRGTWEELLASRLAADWANIAQATEGSRVAGAVRLEDGDIVGPLAKPVVRLVQDYSFDELRLKSNDEAMASELAFCLWTRRRDPHAWNRAYVEDVPVFFDQHVAFAVGLADLDLFFGPAQDAGYPDRWRARLVPIDESLTTLGERQRQGVGAPFAIQPIRDRQAFEGALSTAVDHIRRYDDDRLLREVALVSSLDPTAIAEFLSATRDGLAAAADRMLDVLYRLA